MSNYSVTFLKMFWLKSLNFLLTILRSLCVVCFYRDSPRWASGSSLKKFLDHTQRNTTVGRILWMSSQLVAETSIWQHITLNTVIHVPIEIRTHNLGRRVSADLRLKVSIHVRVWFASPPRGTWLGSQARIYFTTFIIYKSGSFECIKMQNKFDVCVRSCTWSIDLCVFF
jgi:hypothetical protein